MRCPSCGAELNIDGSCPVCAQGNVREMGRNEKDTYDGVTIDAESGQQTGGEYSSTQESWNHSQSQGNNRGYGSYGSGGPRIITFSTGGGLMKKLLIGLAIAAVIGVLLFAVLPMMVIAAVIAIVIYFLYSMLF